MIILKWSAKWNNICFVFGTVTGMNLVACIVSIAVICTFYTAVVSGYYTGVKHFAPLIDSFLQMIYNWGYMSE